VTRRAELNTVARIAVAALNGLIDAAHARIATVDSAQVLVVAIDRRVDTDAERRFTGVRGAFVVVATGSVVGDIEAVLHNITSVHCAVDEVVAEEIIRDEEAIRDDVTGICRTIDLVVAIRVIWNELAVKQ